MHRSLAMIRFAAAVGLLGGALLGAASCDRPARTAGGNASAPSAPSQPLVLLVVEDPPLGQAIAREWRSRTEQELTVREATLADVAAAHRLPADAVIFPSGLVGQLAERGLIQPLASEALETPEFDFRDIFDQIRLREMKWGGRVLSVPLGSPQLLLAYRSDVFERLELTPPTTWSDYQRALARLSDRSARGEAAPRADQPRQAALEPLGEGWAGQLLLARAAAYALHRDQISPLLDYSTLRPLVDQPPYVRALKELAAAICPNI